jgi:hypothetical protein
VFAAKPMNAAVRDRLSLVLLLAGGFAIFGVGAAQLVKDGSLWRDEASVAVSLLELSPLELLGNLDGAQSFPRLYLLAIAGLKSTFGYHTIVLRALPFAFFTLGTAGWLALLYSRLRREPLLLALGVLLTLIPAQWFIQAAMFKPYTFDVCAALVPFLLRDAFYDETLERGERAWRLVPLTLLCALSYPFALVLFARVVGWWVSGLSRGRVRIDPRGSALLAGGTLLFVAFVWVTDLRHTSEIGGILRSFWSTCVLLEPGSSAVEVLERFAFGWYTGDSAFSSGGGLPAPVAWLVRAGFTLGIVRIGLTIFRRDSAADESAPEWGSRSLGYAAVLCGVVCASILAGYPICAGRLTLFALLPLQIVTLEGFSWAAAGIARAPRGRWIATLAASAMLVAVAPTSLRDTLNHVQSAAPDDLRAGLELMRSRPTLPMITTSCTTKQIRTLPEEIDHEVFFVGPGGNLAAAIATGEAWLLHSPASFCSTQIRSLRVASTSWTESYKKRFASRLVHVEFKRAQDPVGGRRR